MILHFAKENDFKVSQTSCLALVLRGKENPQESAGWHLVLQLPLPWFCCVRRGPSWAGS